MSRPDAIVIGAGFGGLGAALSLAERGATFPDVPFLQRAVAWAVRHQTRLQLLARELRLVVRASVRASQLGFQVRLVVVQKRVA